MTPQIFLEWKARFDKEMAEKEAAERGKLKDIKGKLTGKCCLRRWSVSGVRVFGKAVRLICCTNISLSPTSLLGRQLFESDKSLVQSDVNLIEEGDIAVDMSLFEREEGIESESESDDDENAVWKNFGDDD